MAVLKTNRHRPGLKPRRVDLLVIEGGEMLEIKNIVEDIVFDLMDTSDIVKGYEINKNQKMEVAAYVMNRLKPMYITSNKGFTNSIVKYQNDPQFVADVMLHISEACKVVKKSYTSDIIKDHLDREMPYYIFPKIYGKVISSKDFMPLQNGEIYLFIENILSQSIFELWKNPAELLSRDEGIFSFAPKPYLAKPPLAKKTFTFSIVIKSGEHSFDKTVYYDAAPALLNNIEIDFHENVLQLEDIYVPF